MHLTVRTSRFAERQRQLLTMLTDFSILFFTKKHLYALNLSDIKTCKMSLGQQYNYLFCATYEVLNSPPYLA